MENPLRLLFGTGYKTLPYSTYIGQTTIADNTYLSLLIETGIFGLASFVALSFEMLRLSLHAARGPVSAGKVLGTIFFCFWIGEMVQMASGDLITYWRILPIYFWVFAACMQTTPPDRPRHPVLGEG
jgi:O-antigen ligase